jgi:hypothetical protein
MPLIPPTVIKEEKEKPKIIEILIKGTLVVVSLLIEELIIQPKSQVNQRKHGLIIITPLAHKIHKKNKPYE